MKTLLLSIILSLSFLSAAQHNPVDLLYTLAFMKPTEAQSSMTAQFGILQTGTEDDGCPRYETSTGTYFICESYIMFSFDDKKSSDDYMKQLKNVYGEAVKSKTSDSIEYLFGGYYTLGVLDKGGYLSIPYLEEE